MRHTRRTTGRSAILIAVLAVGLVGSSTSAASTRATAGVRSTEEHAASTGTVRVSTRTVKGLGQVLVDSRGRTLYMFVPDKRRKVTCTGSCAVSWPPLKLPKGAKLAASGKAQPKLLGSDPNPAGGRVVTYAHWPLYTYIADTKAGTAFGQATNLNGGLWYVLSPAGKVIRKKP
jgi:predicted lipoprotein with Yx(FWY)xxD motif